MAAYSNIRALRALCTASLQAMLKSPSAVFFTIAFPLVFILVFGFLGTGGNSRMSVAMTPDTDTHTVLYQRVRQLTSIDWRQLPPDADVERLLSEGFITAMIGVYEQPEGIFPRYKILLHSSVTHADRLESLQALLLSAVHVGDTVIRKQSASLATMDIQLAGLRQYKMIDFILPGQLGFSLLAAAVFGTAFVFFNMRQTLVLKRFFATPVRREIIILSEGISRMSFQLTAAMIIIVCGYYFFDFTLIYGWVTFLQMLALCALGLMVFMGFGFVISGLARHETAIPPLSNIITLPQFLLAGTFFPIEQFPGWLQPLCRILPLTYLNDALRKVAFDGAGFAAIQWDISILLIWGVVVYAVAAKVFRWE